MALINPTIDQAKIQSWETNFYTLASQKTSLLSNLPAIKHIDFSAAKHNIVRLNSLEIQEISGRNPKVNYEETSFDNRQIVKRNFAKSILFDKYDNLEMMSDPTSDIYTEVMQAFDRMKDRIIAEACFASVMCGDPNNGVALTSVTAEEDGVKTIDATSGLTYNLLKQAHTNFINSNILSGDLMNSNLSFICAGSDMSQLLDEDKFINNNYTSIRPVDNGVITKVLGMNVVTLAGSQTNQTEYTNPILKEDGTTRDCIILAPDSIRFVVSDVSIEIREPDEYYRSKALVFSARLGAIRTEGAKIQKIKTTF